MFSRIILNSNSNGESSRDSARRMERRTDECKFDMFHTVSFDVENVIKVFRKTFVSVSRDW